MFNSYFCRILLQITQSLLLKVLIIKSWNELNLKKKLRSLPDSQEMITKKMNRFKTLPYCRS